MKRGMEELKASPENNTHNDLLKKADGGSIPISEKGLPPPKTTKINDLEPLSTFSNENRIGIPTGEKEIEYYQFHDILHIESFNTSIVIHFLKRSGLAEITRSISIGFLEKFLPQNQFFRIHNEHIINLIQVKKFSHKDGLFVVLFDYDPTVPVSRQNKSALLKALSKF